MQAQPSKLSKQPLQVIFRLGHNFAIKHADGSYHSGGVERLRMLDFLLTNLIDLGVACYLLTTTTTARPDQDLVRWGLQRHFVGSSGRMRILQGPPDGEGACILEQLQSRGTAADEALYVDTCEEACQRVTTLNPGIRIHRAGIGSGESLRDEDCMAIIDLFQQASVKRRNSSSVNTPQAIFDFDNTLTHEMVYNDLIHAFGGKRNPPTTEMAGCMGDDWWLHEFGGQERVDDLNWMLDELKSLGVKSYICSMNVDGIIIEGLRRTGLAHHFQKGGEDSEFRIIPRGLPNKGLRVRQNLRTYATRSSTALFVDDHHANIASVSEVNPGISQLHCSTQGLSRLECESIVAHFQKLGAK